jgi:selenocysteine lyase/cysteine desulfurase
LRSGSRMPRPIGLVHYNTLDEVDRLVEALREL